MAKPSKAVGKGKKAGIVIEKLVPRTQNQELAVHELRSKQVVILEGLAGTGKTYIAIHHALTMLVKKEIDKIILTRPLTTVGNERLGFLPGDVNDKTRPYAEQFFEYIEEFAPMLSFEDIKTVGDRLEFIPVAYLRGRNFSRSVVIADEMQNSSVLQMKTLLTRIAEDSQLVLLGDLKQEDVQTGGRNGLADLVQRVQNDVDQEFIGHVRFGLDDIQRSEFVKYVMKLYGDI
jgi:phosphate starvation-inducible PhoH-like protein